MARHSKTTTGKLRHVAPILFLWVAGSSQAMAAVDAVTESAVLGVAEGAGRWLIALVQEESAGMSWPDDALQPGVTGYDLAAGVSGKVLFLAALYEATGNERYLHYASEGAAYLVKVLADPANFSTNPRRASLYAGIAGIGVALVNLHRSSPRPEYVTAVTRIVDLLADWGTREHNTLRWSDEFNDLIYGEAGTVLFLAFVADYFGDNRALRMAAEGAAYLESRAQPAEQGVYWYFRRGKPFNLPNFSHGTAGIGYVFATLATLTREESFRTNAEDAFDYLAMITQTEDDSVRIPYGWGAESWDGLYEFGWAHGLSGSALFLQRLQQAGIRTDQVTVMSQAIFGTLSSINLPNEPAPPFAEPSTALDLRFGRAGVLALLSERSRNDDSVVATRDATWSVLAQAAERDEAGGLYWQVEAPEFMGGGTAQYTGYFHGAAGIALAMLDMHAAMTNRDAYVVMPDNPFSWPLTGVRRQLAGQAIPATQSP